MTPGEEVSLIVDQRVEDPVLFSLSIWNVPPFPLPPLLPQGLLPCLCGFTCLIGHCRRLPGFSTDHRDQELERLRVEAQISEAKSSFLSPGLEGISPLEKPGILASGLSCGYPDP